MVDRVSRGREIAGLRDSAERERDIEIAGLRKSLRGERLQGRESL
jgi:hypothetical protein